MTFTSAAGITGSLSLTSTDLDGCCRELTVAVDEKVILCTGGGGKISVVTKTVYVPPQAHQRFSDFDNRLNLESEEVVNNSINVNGIPSTNFDIKMETADDEYFSGPGSVNYIKEPSESTVDDCCEEKPVICIDDMDKQPCKIEPLVLFAEEKLKQECLKAEFPIPCSQSQNNESVDVLSESSDLNVMSQDHVVMQDSYSAQNLTNYNCKLSEQLNSLQNTSNDVSNNQNLNSSTQQTNVAKSESQSSGKLLLSLLQY